MADKKEDKKEVKKTPGNAYVTASFRDKDNFDLVYNEGDDVSHFDAARLAACVESGIVAIEPEPVKDPK